MGKSFREVHLCHTNDFPKCEKIKSWVEANGGTFNTFITPEVTHLIASRKAFRNRSALVKAAVAQGTIDIVNFDWIEDSLSSKTRKPMKTKGYQWQPLRVKPQSQKIPQTVAAHVRQVTRNKKTEDAGIRFDKECAAFVKYMGLSSFHPYVDPTHFPYLLTLLRRDILKNYLHRYQLKVGYHNKPQHRSPCPVPLYSLPKGRKGEGFSLYPAVATSKPRRLTFKNPHLRVPVPNPWAESLQLFESDAKPHSYACFGLYTRPGVKPDPNEPATYCAVAPAGSTWDFAFAAFRKHFKSKTGFEWEDRTEKHLRASTALDQNVDGDEKVVATELWDYIPPRKGEPQGLMLGDGTNTYRNKTGGMASKPKETIAVKPKVMEDWKISVQDRMLTPEGGW